jgi:hypothetical protein
MLPSNMRMIITIAMITRILTITITVMIMAGTTITTMIITIATIIWPATLAWSIAVPIRPGKRSPA